MVEVIEDRALPNGGRYVVLGGLGLIFGESGRGVDSTINTRLSVWNPYAKAEQHRPILYEHGGPSATTQKAIVGPIGTITDEWITSEGVRVRGVLKWTHPAAPRVREEALKGLLGWSRGAAPGGLDVEENERGEPVAMKALTIAEWSVTMFPADWRQLPHRLSKPSVTDWEAIKAGRSTKSQIIKVYTVGHNPCEIGGW